MFDSPSKIMVSSWSSWLDHARKYEETDPYATYLLLYISFAIYCKEHGYVPERDSGNLSSSDVSTRKFADNEIFDKRFRLLSSTSRYKKAVSSIQEYFENNGSFQIRDYDTGQWVDARIGARSLSSHVWWLKAVRNNLIHGNKSMDIRGEVIVSMACNLMFALYDEIIIGE